MEDYSSLSEAINGLKKEGYTEDFNISENCIECSALSLKLFPEDFVIDKFFRFEGQSNPDDSSIIYAISAANGVKGILVDAFGIYSEAMTPDLIAKLKMAY